ncbi:hypothetical protein ACFL0S_04110, partial [Thermodesulfobacteriota bacterium]
MQTAFEILVDMKPFKDITKTVFEEDTQYPLVPVQVSVSFVDRSYLFYAEHKRPGRLLFCTHPLQH